MGSVGPNAARLSGGGGGGKWTEPASGLKQSRRCKVECQPRTLVFVCSGDGLRRAEHGRRPPVRRRQELPVRRRQELPVRRRRQSDGGRLQMSDLPSADWQSRREEEGTASLPAGAGRLGRQWTLSTIFAVCARGPRCADPLFGRSGLPAGLVAISVSLSCHDVLLMENELVRPLESCSPDVDRAPRTSVYSAVLCTCSGYLAGVCCDDIVLSCTRRCAGDLVACV